MKRNHIYEYGGKNDLILERERTYDLHLKRLHEINEKKVTVNRAPVLIMQQANTLKQRSKTLIKLKETKKIINRNNESLFEKLIDIQHRSFDSKQFTRNEDGSPHNLSLNFRKQRAELIQEENIRMANRILKQEACIKLENLQEQHTFQQQIKQRLMKITCKQEFLKKLRTTEFTTRQKLSPLNSQRMCGMSFSSWQTAHKSSKPAQLLQSMRITEESNQTASQASMVMRDQNENNTEPGQIMVADKLTDEKHRQSQNLTDQDQHYSQDLSAKETSENLTQ